MTRCSDNPPPAVVDGRFLLPCVCHSATRAAQQYSRTLASSNRAPSWANLKRRSRPTRGNAQSVTNLSAVADAQHRAVACAHQSGSPPSHLRACTTCILTRPLQVHALPSTELARRTAFEPAARLPCTSQRTHRWSWLQSFLGEGGKHACQSSTREVAGPAGCSRPGRRVYRAVVESRDRPVVRRVRLVVASHQ